MVGIARLINCYRNLFICMNTTRSSNPGSAQARERSLFQNILTTLAAFTSGCGVLGILMGQFITFYPGSEQGWFTACGVMVLAGLLLPRWYHRVGAVLLVALCALAAVQGHQYGEEYKARLAARHEKLSSR
jgi:hypothetical protein